MTIPLYDEYPFEKTFSARVLSCEKADDERYRIVLDKTLFFPEQGGQTSDKGYIAEAKVLDVQIDNEVITHYCDRELSEGCEVEGEIDWSHRFNNMQQHTGEHIFTGLAHNKFGAENVGFHLSDNTVTLDLDIELTEAQVKELEYESNLVISEDVAIKCYYPKEEELNKIEYRSKIAIEGAVRIVEIQGIDKCACCAPHVATTGQVGMLKVLSFGKYKGGTRVYIICGLRALEEFNKKQLLLAKTYQKLNCQEEDVPVKAASLIDDNKRLKYELLEIKAKQLLAQIENYPSELLDVTVFVEDLDAKVMRDGVNALVEKHEGLCSIFSGNDDDGYSFVIGSKTRDCGAIAAGLRQLLGAKGGGSKVMAQGSVMATRSEIENVL